MPLAGIHAIVTADPGPDLLAQMQDVGRLGALAAWRVTQGIYRFDPALYERVAETPVSRDIPCDVLYHLPEWCVYIETPGLTFISQPMHGFFAHLEYDINSGRHELRLVIDGDQHLLPFVLHLGHWPLADALDKALDEGQRQSLMAGYSRAAGVIQKSRQDQQGLLKLLDELEHMISLLLFLCSQPEEVGQPGNRPVNPQPKRTKQGWRLFQAEKATTWDVGVRIGAALRRAYQQAETGQQNIDPGTGKARPRPHVRRAHWHGFWKGPKDPERAAERRFDLRWMPPIPVGIADYDDLPAVVHPVKE